jgi:hypothetical protein
MATADASAPQHGPPRRCRRGLDILPILFKQTVGVVVVGAQNKKVATCIEFKPQIVPFIFRRAPSLFIATARCHLHQHVGREHST